HSFLEESLPGLAAPNNSPATPSSPQQGFFLGTNGSVPEITLSKNHQSFPPSGPGDSGISVAATDSSAATLETLFSVSSFAMAQSGSDSVGDLPIQSDIGES